MILFASCLTYNSWLDAGKFLSFLRKFFVALAEMSVFKVLRVGHINVLTGGPLIWYGRDKIFQYARSGEYRPVNFPWTVLTRHIVCYGILDSRVLSILDE